MRHLFLAGVLTTALVPVAATAGTLQPESTWAITRIGAKDERSAPYCALARRFQNNIIMTIARNTRDEMSLAIDFQQPVFQDGQSVNVSFNSGIGPARDFILQPASNKAVVARIGADQALLKELESSGNLDVAVMGQSYRFVIADMANANGQMATCIGALQMPGVPAEGGMDDKIAALQDQIQTLKSQRESMAAKVENTDVYGQQLSAVAGGGSNADLVQKINELQMKNLALRDNVENSRGAYENLQTKTLEDRSRVALLEETQDQLKRAEQETKQFRDQLYMTQTRQDELLVKLEKYSTEEQKRKELESHLAMVMQENEQLVGTLRAEKDKLELVRSAQEAVVAQQEQELVKTKAQLEQTALERDKTKAELDIKATELVQTNEKLDTYKTRLNEYSGIKDKLTALAAEQKQLGATVDTLQAERTDLSTRLDNEKARLEEIQASKKKLELQYSSSEEEKAKLAKLLEDEKVKQAEVDALEKNLDALKAKQVELAGKVEALEGEKASLQGRVSDLEAKVKDAEAAKAKISSALDETKADRERLATSLKEMESNKTKLETALGDVKSEKEKLSATLTESKTDKEKLAKALDETKGRAVELEKSLDEVEAAKVKLQEAMNETQKRQSTLEDAVKQANSDKAQTDQLLKTVQSERALMAQSLDQMKASQDELTRTAEQVQKELRTQLVAREEENRKLAEVAAHKEEENKKLAQVASQADEKVAAQTKTIDDMTMKQKDLLTQIAGLEGEKKNLLASLTDQKTQLASIESQSKKDRDFKYEFDRLKEELNKVARERDGLRVALSDLKTKNIDLAQSRTPDNDVRQLYTQMEELEYQRVDLNSALEFERKLNDAAPATGGDSIAELKASLAAAQAERDEFARLLDAERLRSKQIASGEIDNGARDTVASLTSRIKVLETDNVNLLRELEYEKSRSADLAVNAPVAPGASSADVVTVNRLRDEVKRLQKRSKQLEGEQGQLLAQVRTLESAKQKINNAQPDAAPSVATTDQEKEDLKLRIASLEAEKSSLTRTLSEHSAKARQAPAADNGTTIAGLARPTITKETLTPGTKVPNPNAPLAAAPAPTAQQLQSAEFAQQTEQEITSLKTQLAQAQTLLAAKEAQTRIPRAQDTMQAPQNTYAMAMAPKSAMAPVQDGGDMASRAPVIQVANAESVLRALISKSGIGTPSEFGPVTLPVESNVQAWRWKIGAINGNAEAHVAPDMSAQSAVIDRFISNAKSRCPGDFAVIENSRTQSEKGLVVSTDIACVAGVNGVAAAIAFIQSGPQMIAVAQEADTANMPDAMMARDKLVQGALK